MFLILIDFNSFRKTRFESLKCSTDERRDQTFNKRSIATTWVFFLFWKTSSLLSIHCMQILTDSTQIFFLLVGWNLDRTLHTWVAIELDSGIYFDGHTSRDSFVSDLISNYGNKQAGKQWHGSFRWKLPGKWVTIRSAILTGRLRCSDWR